MERKILIVEDEMPQLTSQKYYFEKRGFVVFMTTKGDEALAIIAKEKPAAVLLDLHLKDSPVTGMDVLKETTEKYPGIKVIVMTGYGDDEETKNMCMKYNPYLFLSKPVSLVSLKEKLDGIFAGGEA